MLHALSEARDINRIQSNASRSQQVDTIYARSAGKGNDHMIDLIAQPFGSPRSGRDVDTVRAWDGKAGIQRDDAELGGVSAEGLRRIDDDSRGERALEVDGGPGNEAGGGATCIDLKINSLYEKHTN